MTCSTTHSSQPAPAACASPSSSYESPQSSDSLQTPSRKTPSLDFGFWVPDFDDFLLGGNNSIFIMDVKNVQMQTSNLQIVNFFNNKGNVIMGISDIIM